ncbi:MAG: YfhO family protein, partial [Blautia sp.]|nr:YfhO family protein [Blautia sp.]
EETTALGKRLYENPYALPMGFLVPGEKAGDALSREEAEELLSGLQQEENPFLYQNRLYSILLGRKVELYLPVEHTGTVTASAADYAMDMPEGNYALYGNLEWSKNMEGTLLVNGEYETDYSCWLSPSVFYIPAVSGQKDIHVRLNAKNGIGIASDQFYVLDLDLLGEISALLSEGMPEDLTVENGKVSCTVDGEDGEYLFLSVPYEEGWRITNNNETIEPVPVDDCLMLLPLSGGENRIVLTYHVRGGRAGILGSVAGILLMLFMAFLEKRQIKKEKI